MAITSVNVWDPIVVQAWYLREMTRPDGIIVMQIKESLK